MPWACCSAIKLQRRRANSQETTGKPNETPRPVKRVIDYNVKVRVKADETGVETANVKMSMNPFDEIAVEEAVRLQEAGTRPRVIAVSIGVQQCQETIRTALAMGADRGIHVKTDEELQPLAVAKLLEGDRREGITRLVILGKQAIDDDSNQTGQMLAACWAGRRAHSPPKIDIARARRTSRARSMAGWRRIEINMPAVITTDLAPERAALCVLAKHHEGEEEAHRGDDPEDLGVDIAPRLTTLKVDEPPNAKLA